MSWENKINNIKFSITTGDGKVYFPLWKGATKETEYNATIFDFINVSGSLIERKKPKGASIPLTFWFDGSDNIEKTEAFERSAADSRFWEVTHPFYGTIKGQPMRLSRNDENLNITEITVDFWESIDVDYPNQNFSVKDNSLEKKRNLESSIAQSFSAKNIYKSEDILKIKEVNINNSSSFTKAISENKLIANDVYAEYQNQTAKAFKASDNLMNDAFDAIVQAQNLLDIPTRIETSVKVRLDAFLTAFEKSKTILNTVADKLLFQSNAGTIIANYANASVNPLDSDYSVVTEIQEAQQNLLKIFNEYLQILDNSYVSIYDVEETFNPDASVLNQLYDLVIYTSINLFNLGFDSQQERIIYTDKDTNLILLAHKYLGLDVNDDNLEEFRVINNIQNNELFRIRKNRKIKYYV